MMSTSSWTMPASDCDHCSIIFFGLELLSYDKCASSVQSRLGSIQTDDEFDSIHIQILEDMNNVSGAPIIGQTLEQFTIMKESNCKNSSMPEQKHRQMHLSQDMSAPDAHISPDA